MNDWDALQEDHGHSEVASAAARRQDRAFFGHGLVSQSRIASSLGWRAVGDITAGDKVLTFDNGMQTVVCVRRAMVRIDPETVVDTAMPVMVPTGALGNRVTLSLMPNQGVMVESDAACDAQGDPFAIIPASALVGFRGITRGSQPCEYEIITLCFASAQLIYVEAGTLVYCPASSVDLLEKAGGQYTLYEMLDPRDATRLVECMQDEDLSGEIRPADKEAANAA